MQRKEKTPRWYFLKKKTSLKPEIFSIGTKQAGQGRRSIVPPEACLKDSGKFYHFTLFTIVHHWQGRQHQHQPGFDVMHGGLPNSKRVLIRRLVLPDR